MEMVAAPTSQSWTWGDNITMPESNRSTLSSLGPAPPFPSQQRSVYFSSRRPRSAVTFPVPWCGISRAQGPPPAQTLITSSPCCWDSLLLWSPSPSLQFILPLPPFSLPQNGSVHWTLPLPCSKAPLLRIKGMRACHEPVTMAGSQKVRAHQCMLGSTSDFSKDWLKSSLLY